MAVITSSNNNSSSASANTLYVLRRHRSGAQPPLLTAGLVQDVRAALRSWAAPAGRRAVILMEAPDQVMASLCWEPKDEISARLEFSKQCEMCEIAWTTAPALQC